jgi:hypothetical protein
MLADGSAAFDHSFYSCNKVSDMSDKESQEQNRNETLIRQFGSTDLFYLHIIEFDRC